MNTTDCLFHFNAIRNRVDLMNDILKDGIDIDSPDGWGDTALMKACLSNSFQAVKYLVERGANLYHRNDDDDGVLDHLLKYNPEPDIQILDYLLTKTTLQKLGGEKILMALCKEGRGIDIIKILLSRGVDINYRNQIFATPLYIAYCFNRRHKVKLLCENGAIIDGMAFGFVVTADDIDTARYFVKRGMNVSHIRNNLHYAKSDLMKEYLEQVLKNPILSLKLLTINTIYRHRISHDHLPRMLLV